MNTREAKLLSKEGLVLHKHFAGKSKALKLSVAASTEGRGTGRQRILSSLSSAFISCYGEGDACCYPPELLLCGCLAAEFTASLPSRGVTCWLYGSAAAREEVAMSRHPAVAHQGMLPSPKSEP